MQKNTLVKLKTFLGKTESTQKVSKNENYWLLIGQMGKIVEELEHDKRRVSVLFDCDLDALGLENHNPIKNSLFILKSDLEIIG